MKSLQDYSIFISGEKKIGKTTLSAQFPDALHLFFEPGGKALSGLYAVPVNSWADFKRYLKLLRTDTRFKNIVIDTADLAYRRCSAYVCARMGIEHPSDEGYGKGWDRVKDEFLTSMSEVQNLGKGVVFIAHSTEKEVTSRNGEKFDRIVPQLPGQARDVLEGMVDIWVYYNYQAKRRVLTVVGDELVAAGHRCENNFRYTDGSPVTDVPAGKSAQQAYTNFVAAFENRLERKEDEKKTKSKKLTLNFKKGRNRK